MHHFPLIISYHPTLKQHFHVLQFHALQMVRQFHARHFQRPLHIFDAYSGGTARTADFVPNDSNRGTFRRSTGGRQRTAFILG